MNWTSRKPIENCKCIVETESGCVFPAHCINGTWWNTEKGFPVDGVKRWIVYPEGEDPNDYIAPEALLKYLMQEYKRDRAALESVRELNKNLCSTYGKTKDENIKLKEENRRMKAELRQAKDVANRLDGMFKRISKVMEKAEALSEEKLAENKTEEEFVA